jgi:hypothetical protein
MDRSRLILPLAFGALACVLGACSSSTAPDGPVSFTMAADSVGNAASPVRFSARVVNAGWKPVWHYEGCGAGRGLGLHVFDAAGREVLLHDTSMMPACADFISLLGPGQALTLATSFVGTQYVFFGASGYVPVPVPPGNYEVRIGFSYSRDGSPPNVVLAGKASFRWLPPPEF